MRSPTSAAVHLPVWNSRNLIAEGEPPRAALSRASGHCRRSGATSSDLILLGPIRRHRCLCLRNRIGRAAATCSRHALRGSAHAWPRYCRPTRPGLLGYARAMVSWRRAAPLLRHLRRHDARRARADMCSSAPIRSAATNNFRASIRPSSFWSATASARCWDARRPGPSGATPRSPASSNRENRSRTRWRARYSRKPASRWTGSNITPRSPGPFRHR